MNNRYEFILLFDVINGNPNGDPDAGNQPRTDIETGRGLVSDVCLKRKIRNFITLVKRDASGAAQPGYDIYVKEKAVLNQQHDRAYEALGLKKDEKDGKKVAANQDAARQWMCQTFFDIRMFGAVMSTGTNCGQVRGPVQIAFSSSLDTINSAEQTVTRMAVTTEKEAEKQSGDNRTMGRKYIVPYGLYQAHGFINPFLAQQTGFNEDDLALLWQSLVQMFEHDRSAARGLMSAQKLIVFKHDSALGNAPAGKLFKLVKTKLKDGIAIPRSFDDYEVKIDPAPGGVEIIEML